ncbi:Tubulin beta-2 chain [Tulasnella sp. 330]|nr:Tubulin beta-2 chain [Tulasnella sp. 330]KAG8884381.1 Tubulin beta-2 chain [Tulasnella sp. 331]KAG8888050.1 Tubulin beta-2 chain [Tulasnella sp. 332]
MPQEIINIQIGQAGNQVGQAFWQTVLAEHGLDLEGIYHGNDTLQLPRAGVYFSEVENQGRTKWVPRSIQIDLESGVCNRIRSGPLGSLFRPDTYIHGESGAGNNWAKGYYTEGAELVDQILDVLRRQIEGCDALQGFQMIQSLGGGTGSGLGSLVLSKIREEVPDRMLATFSVLPSPKNADTVVEPYNTVLSLNQLVETSDLTFCVDNEALHNISARLGGKSTEFSQLNTIVAQVMAGVSTSLRFPGLLNGDLRKIGMNLVPFPRLHFLAPSYAPIVPPGRQAFQNMNVQELTTSLFYGKSYLIDANPLFGKWLTAATIFRGKFQSRDCEHAVQQLQQKHSSSFVEWIPDNISITLCTVPPVGQRQAAVCLANMTSIKDVFKRSLDQFSAMFKRRAFLMWYEGEGMDPMEFTEAESNVQDLIAEYQQYENATAEDEEEFEAGAANQTVEYAESSIQGEY